MSQQQQHTTANAVPQQDGSTQGNQKEHNDKMVDSTNHNGDNQNSQQAIVASNHKEEDPIQNKEQTTTSTSIAAKQVGNGSKNGENKKNTYYLSQQQYHHGSQVATYHSSSVQLHSNSNNNNNNNNNNKQGYHPEITHTYSAYFHNNNSMVTPKKHSLRITHSQSQQSSNTSSALSQLFQAKQSHKETSVRLQILTNRINKLALEDKMITEKAEDTEAKANIIFEVKLREQNKKWEQMYKKNEADEIKFTHPIAQMEKRKIQISRQFIIDRNKEEALALKKQNAMLSQAKAIQSQTTYDNARAKIEKIKKEKEHGSTLRSNFFLKRVEDVQAYQMDVLENERRQQQRKEEILKTLEQKEQEQLAKLMNTKQRNKNAQEQLQFSKTQQTKEYESRFGTPHKPKVVKTINGLPASRFQNQAVVYVLKEDKQGLTVLKTSQNK